MKSFKNYVNESINKVKPLSGIDNTIASQITTTLNQALENKSIYNVDLKKMTTQISSQYDYMRTKFIDNVSEYSRGKDYDPQKMNFLYPELSQFFWEVPHNFTQLGKFIRTYKKSKHKPISDGVKQFEEFAEYAKAIKSLKQYVIKGRKPNPDTVSKEKFNPERINSKALKEITDILNGVVDNQYKSLINSLTEQYDKYVENFFNKRKDMQSVYDFYSKQAGIRGIVARLVRDADNRRDFKMGNPIKVEDYENIKKKIAIEVANDLKERYLVKNIEKIGSLIYKKKSDIKNMKSFGKFDGFGFNGEIKIEFDDNTGFDVRNKAVLVFSGWSDPFYRFPTTFHNVRFSDGSIKKMRSQEQMNKEWVD